MSWGFVPRKDARLAENVGSTKELKHRRTSRLPWVLLGLGGCSLFLGCDTLTRNLGTRPKSEEAGAAGYGGSSEALPETLAGYPFASLSALTDARPDGAASLSGGTQGGGPLATAYAGSRVFVVQTPGEFAQAVQDDQAAIVLLVEGSYDFSGNQRSETICTVSCPAGSARTTQDLPQSKCADGTPLTQAGRVLTVVPIGSHKTILGLGSGSRLQNVELDLSGSSDLILRNLELDQPSPDIAETSVALRLWPSDHVWIDHCTIRGASHSLINILSIYENLGPLYPLTQQASHITLSYNEIDGTGAANCSGSTAFGIGTQRNPALTIHGNWLHGAAGGSPYLFGPETWAHVYDNVIEGNSSYGTGAACAGAGILEGNFYGADLAAFHLGDEGAGLWPFCATGLMGRLYAPSDGASLGTNAFDPAAQTSLLGLALEGSGLSLPGGSASTRTISVPLVTGAETYTYSLPSPIGSHFEALRQGAGRGHLFP